MSTSLTAQGSPPGVADSWHCLRALHVGHDEGWFTFIGADLDRHTFVLQFDDGRYRTLRRYGTPRHRPEGYWWTRGVADRHELGPLIGEILDGQVPSVITASEAANLLPAVDRLGRAAATAMTEPGVLYNVRAGRLYPIYGPHRRYLFAAQIAADAAARRLSILRHDLTAAEAAGKGSVRIRARINTEIDRAVETRATWREIRRLLPDAIRLDALAVDVVTGPSPTPLPIGPSNTEAFRRQTALMIGDQAGWFRYLEPVGGGAAYAVEVTVDGQPVRLEVPGWGVLPYVLGHADVFGAGASVAYREDLG